MKLYRIISENGSQAALVALDDTERVDVHEATPWLSGTGTSVVWHRYYRPAQGNRAFIRYGTQADATSPIDGEPHMREVTHPCVTS